MQTLYSSNREKCWVVTPIREKADSVGAYDSIVEKLSEHELTFVSAIRTDEATYVAYSDSQGFDLAETIHDEYEQPNVIYLEKTGDDYLYVRITGGVVSEDRLMSKAELLQVLESRVSYKNNVKEFAIYSFNCDADVQESVSRLAYEDDDGNAWVTKLSRSLLDTLACSDDFEFVEPNFVRGRLFKKGNVNSKSKAAFVAALALLLWCVYLFWGADNEKQIVTVYKDDYQKYRVILTEELPEVSSRLKQAFNIHVLLETVPNWKISKVNFSKETHNPQFLMKRAGNGTLQGLTEYAQRFGLMVYHDKSGVWLQTFGANISPYTNDSLRVFGIDNVYSNVSDLLGFIARHVEMESLDHVVYDATQGVWESKRVSLNFKAATKHDLLRIAAVFRRLPVTLEQANYTVERDVFQGSIIIQIHGEA